MISTWTFPKQVTAGFFSAAFFLLIIGGVSYRSTDTLTRTGEQVVHTYAVIKGLGDLLSVMKDAETGQRGYVITGDESFLAPYNAALGNLGQVERDLRALLAENPWQLQRLDAVQPSIDAKLAELKHTIEVRRSQGFDATQRIVRDGLGKRMMDELRLALGEIESNELDQLAQRRKQAEGAARLTKATILIGTLLAFIVVTFIATLIIRSLTGRLGAAIQHLQGSTAELQSTASEQATGAKEQTTAMTEITTTTKELLATSRQIAESSQRVAQIAEQTAASARQGDQTVLRAQGAVAAIQRQVDLIVSHMLDLGKKSQQIGGILEIINELAEQTNILSINATIEAAGAGEMGRRFAVVADEIRKLADRVGGSTREIRTLIEEIRAAVHTTVMATESGAKAVDAGTQKFGEVKDALRQIVVAVEISTEAAKEIELSTKQQATAVGQVNVGIADVAQAAREMEVGAGQTLQTATELARLSRDLLKLVQDRPTV